MNYYTILINVYSYVDECRNCNGIVHTCSILLFKKEWMCELPVLVHIWAFFNVFLKSENFSQICYDGCTTARIVKEA